MFGNNWTIKSGYRSKKWKKWFICNDLSQPAVILADIGWFLTWFKLGCNDPKITCAVAKVDSKSIMVNNGKQTIFNPHGIEISMEFCYGFILAQRF